MKRILWVLLALALSSQPILAASVDVILNVARSIIVGPAIDKTDGVTPETALTPGTFVVWKYPKNKAPVSVTIATAVNATSTITASAAFANNDTITFTGTLDGTLITETYTWKTTLTGATNEIKASTVAATDLDNLKCAINDNNTGCAAGEGTDYGTGTVASVLVNATTNGATTQVVVANIPGTLGNSVTTAETSGASISWTGSTLSGGVDGMLHANVGYYWFCQPATFWDTLGDMKLTFNYAAEAAPFWQDVRVVANASNEVMVQGLGSTIDGLLETDLSTVGSPTAWTYKLNNLDASISSIATLIGTPVVSVSSDIAGVQSDTNDIQLKIGTPVVSLAADIAAAKGDSAAIKVKTDFLPSVTAGAAGGLFIAGTNAATTITTAFTTTFTGNLTGSVGSVTGAVGSVTGSVGSVTGAVGSVTGTIGGLTAAALANFFNVNSGTTYASAVAGSVVKEITDNSGGAGFTTADIADAVWDEATAGHGTAGTTGKALTDASSAGDPWSTALPGAYSAGTAGKIVGDRLDVLVSTRASQTTLDTAQAGITDLQARTPGALVGGRMDASVGAMQANVITAASINEDAFTAAKFAADASAEFAATLMVTTYEGAETFKHFLQYGAAVLFGKSATSPGLQTFRDLADTKNRISSTTSSSGRTSVTLNPD